MAIRGTEALAQYLAMSDARKEALKLVQTRQLNSPCDLDGMVVLHPFREGELVRFDTLMAQAEATSMLTESGPGLEQETRYLLLLELCCKHMPVEDGVLFRYACGLEEDIVGGALREGYDLPVRFIFPDTQVA